MNETLATLLEMIVEIIQGHSERLTTLEEGESDEDSGDPNLMQEVSALLAQLQSSISATDQM